MRAARSALDRIGSRPRVWLGAILAVALAARVGAILATPGYEPVFDSADYERHALSIAAGDGFPDSVFAAEGGPSAFRPPLYPYLLGAVYALSGDSLLAGRLAGAVLGVVLVLLVYLTAKLLWNVRAGLVAAALAAVAPPLVLLSLAIATEPLFLALELAAVLFALHSRARGGDLRLAAAAGAMCGLAALTRSNGLLLVIPIALGVIAIRPRLSRAGLAAPAAVVVAAALTVVPWTVRNAITFERLVPISSQSGFALAGAYNDEAMDEGGYRATWILPELTSRYGPLYERSDLDDAELDAALRRGGVEYALDHPRFVLETAVLNTLRTLELIPSHPAAVRAHRSQGGLSAATAQLERWSSYVLLLLAVAGLAVLARRPPDVRPPLFVWLTPVLLLVAALPILGIPRYRAPLYPFLVLAATPVLVTLADHREPRRSPARAPARAR